MQRAYVHNSGGVRESLQLPAPREVALQPASPERLIALLDPAQVAAVTAAMSRAPMALGGRTTINVNSTAAGGGVAEMLGSLLPYTLGAGVDTRWLVIDGDREFFAVTKRLHNHLHGVRGDGGALDGDARTHYENVSAVNAAGLARSVQPDDIVILHDPQTAGMIPLLKARGHSVVIWRCHVGVDEPNTLVRGAWDFLRPHVAAADAVIFSRAEYVWDGLAAERVAIIAPSIDPLAAKNSDMPADAVAAVLAAAGIQDGASASTGALFVRQDGSAGAVTSRAELVEVSRLTPSTRVIAQVSRWDRLKDPVGVIDAFAGHVAPWSDAHLVVAGPAVGAVSDDPEGYAAYVEARTAALAVARPARERIHLATLPMNDLEENAIIVNALQRRADVVVQKSLAEGFGLTVAEAMWKARPVVASRVGGIREQIEDGASGSLVEPHDLSAFGSAVLGYLSDTARAERTGAAARERVRAHFLGSRHLLQYLDLLSSLLKE